MDRVEKRLDATLKIVQTGMKMLVKIEQDIRALTESQRALTEAQRKTDRKFDRLIDSWTRRRNNGHQTKS